MKRKTNTVEAAPLPTCATIGAEDMVLVACSSGESFLIERNCALLSSHCRDVLQQWEGAIRRMTAQSRGEQSVTTATTTPADTGAVNFPTGERSSAVRMLAEPLENQNMTIPFMAAWDGSADASAAPQGHVVHHIALSTVAEHYQQRLDIATPTKIERPSSSKVPSSHGERKGVMVVPKPLSPLAPMEDDGGVLLYPVIHLPYVTPELLESSLSYASRKYRMDVDGEKSATEAVPPVSAIATGDPWQTIAAAVLTGM